MTHVSSSEGLNIQGFDASHTAVYKVVDGHSLKLHVFLPPDHASTDQRTAILFFFGGGWMIGNPSQFFPHCAYLASRGMVAVSAEYRVQKQHGTSPQECVKDGKSAMRWLRAHAAEWGIDPDKILAGGGSAGGHVAAATATLEDFNESEDDCSISCKPAALVLFNPVFNNGPESYGYDRVKDYWQSFSPAHNLSTEPPPTLVLFGTQDVHVPVTMAEDYKQQMEALGRRCDLHFYEGQPHGFFNYTEAQMPYYRATVRVMDRFLASLNYLDGEPTIED
ncbi:alpha/beta hydrolase [Coraliomargarita algicola]|uniref:Alpha/beta hydrolase n=1 Tax=Coraliomargarita algicola TaxID=3092156 RepID=A0ABZ0RRV2_9BACT|nr:alpha/beta hydrolase [Coraliomargarita sp. J2-16]WPJ97520.1 alpha/beta hydrolase [Coraliomargarita sp. J2-16]